VPGSDALHVTLFIDAPMRLAGRTVFEATDALEGEGRFRVRVRDVRALSLWLLPYVAPGPGGADSLQFRTAEAVFLAQSAERGDAADVPLSSGSIDLSLFDGLDALRTFLELMAVFVPPLQNVAFAFIMELIVAYPAPGWFSGSLDELPTSPLGALYTSLATTEGVGPIVFGLSPVLSTPRPYADGTLGTITVEDGWAVTPSLDLRFRGGDLGTDVARLLDLQSQPVTNGTSACCIGGERDPACLVLLADTDPDTLCPLIACSPVSP
jgi:hypothetical protein